MGRFNDRDNRSGGGGRGFGGNRGFGRRDSGPREKFHAVCDNCGKDCEVPFKPSGDKPVYCSDCFEKQGGRDSRPQRSGGRSDRSENSNKELLESINSLNTKLDTIIELLQPKEKTKAKAKK